MNTFIGNIHSVNLAFEKCFCNLYDLLQAQTNSRGEKQGFCLSLSLSFLRQILKGLLFLSNQGVMHCDLKPENLLLVSPEKPWIKITDFGIAQKLSYKKMLIRHFFIKHLKSLKI